ncbi:3-dehydroquinate dehydratase [Paenibacillus sp. GCM10027629]|uniref:3-dehydroquinate dehydratase n=1 Tax=Paenibacillus TaxID=44249 RepID=UPI001266D35D|nr:3-dehydroquinate dehydratase [Paenibacillus guangzhouensis]
MTKQLINFQNKTIPVFYTSMNKKTLTALLTALDSKMKNGKKAIKKCLDTLISIEIIGCEAILHSKRESDTLALSLF